MSNSDGDPIRIVRIIDRLNIGGPAKHVTWLTSGLDPKRFCTTLIAGSVPANEGDMTYYARKAGIDPIIIKEMSRELSAADLVVIAKLVRLLFQLRPQIVHTHKAKAGAVGRTAALIYRLLTFSLFSGRRCGTVHTFHGHIFHSYYGPLKSRLFIWIERLLAMFCTDRIIAISPQQRSEIQGHFNVGGETQFDVISLGIDLDEIDSAAAGRLRAELKIEPDVPLVGIVGRLCEIKNQAMFIEAAARVCEKDSTAQFAVIGNGELRVELEGLAQAREMQDRIHFLGFRADMLSLYQDLDIAAITSLNEGTPLTLIEAMSNGCALASTDVGGVTDLMGSKLGREDGFLLWEHGVTVPSRDIEAFSRALQFLIDNPSLRKEMGERGREFAQNRFSKERLIADIENLYYKLAKDL